MLLLLFLLYMLSKEDKKYFNILSAADKTGTEVNFINPYEKAYTGNIEIKYILKQALTDKVNDREVYMKGIDYSYYYEGYVIYKAENL